MELEQAARVLPPELRQAVLALPEEERRRSEEIRLRVGQPLSLVLGEEERFLNTGAVTAQQLTRLVEIASRCSFHTVVSQLRRGYLTLVGGHRVGLCGTAGAEQGAVTGFRAYSSANVRIARCVPGAARPLMGRLCPKGRLESTLIVSPPGGGKTTLLRDLVRCVSEGQGCLPGRVGLADERGEVAALLAGCPQLDVGRRTDVLEGCHKSEAILMLLRAMNPGVIAVDEITDPEDIYALRQAAGCGVVLLATAHGADRHDLNRRPVYRELMEQRLFRQLVVIHRCDGQRQYSVEELE